MHGYFYGLVYTNSCDFSLCLIAGLPVRFKDTNGGVEAKPYSDEEGSHRQSRDTSPSARAQEEFKP